MVYRAYETDQFTLIIGVTPGYFHDNELANTDFVSALATEWQKLMEIDGEQHGGVFVPAVASQGRAVYHSKWGCPQGGEQVVMFTGTRNPKFVPDAAAWKQAVMRIVAELQTVLKQTTAQVDFQVVNMIYCEG